MIIFSALGVLFSRRLVHSAFSLFGMLMALAGAFATLGAHSATFAQVILYVGGVMVLVVFALFLNPESNIPKWTSVKQNFTLSLLLIAVVFWGIFNFPFAKFNDFFLENSSQAQIVSHPSLTGKLLASNFGTEFEVLGLLLLAAIVLAGWYLKANEETQK